MGSPATIETSRLAAEEPGAGGRKNRRAFLFRVVVLRDLQLKLMLHHALAFVIAVLGVAAMLFGPLFAELDHAEESHRAAAADQLLALHVSFWPAAAVGLAFVMLFSLVLSHRIAGPLYRLRHSMRAVGSGRILGPISLRTHDFLQDDAAAFNEMLAGLRTRLAGVGEKQEALSGLVRELEAADPGDPDALRARVAELSKRSRAVEAELEGFRVEGPTATPGDDRAE